MSVSNTHTCAINWMILTNILRGMSLGTTLRLPLGNSVEVMDVRRLREERGVKRVPIHERDTLVKIIKWVIICAAF